MRLLAFALFILAPLALHGETWQALESRDGRIKALVPGKPERSTQKRKVLTAEFITHVARYQTDSVIFDLAYTPVKPRFVKFAKSISIKK